MTNDHPTPFHTYCVAITRVFRLSVTLQLLSYSFPPYCFVCVVAVYVVAANTTVFSEPLLSNKTYKKFWNDKMSSWKMFVQMELYINFPVRNFYIRKLLNTKISQTTVVTTFPSFPNSSFLPCAYNAMIMQFFNDWLIFYYIYTRINRFNLCWNDAL